MQLRGRGRGDEGRLTQGGGRGEEGRPQPPCMQLGVDVGHANSISGVRAWAKQAAQGEGHGGKEGLQLLTGNNFGRGLAAPAAAPATTYFSYAPSSTSHCTCRDLFNSRSVYVPARAVGSEICLHLCASSGDY